MSDTEIEISAQCPACGGRIVWPDDATDKTMLSCADCGLEVGTYGNFMKKALEVLRDETADSDKNASGDE